MKKIHRFLVSEITDKLKISIENKDLIHLIKNVLKIAIGEECIVFEDGGNDYLTTVSQIEKNSIILNVKSVMPKKNTPKNITACISITKRDSFELIVQKLTEIGVKNIIPIISERTIKQALRIDRLQKISDEALEQSGGSDRMKISEPQILKDVLENKKGSPQFYFDITGKKNIKTTEKDLTFYIGPEGGWSDGDKILFRGYDIEASSLGKTILRAETAAIVAGYKLLWD